jgi:uncharacterized membrane protein
MLVLLIVILFLFFFWKKKRIPDIPEQKAISEELPVNNTIQIENKTPELPEDLRELYDLILKKGGRTTQKEIRKDSRYGEAKVSLMLADLEDRGFVKKIKKGRSNIIIAENIKQ